jgi:hypothetical protein
MVKNNPIQYSSKVLDQRNTLTGSNESEYPKKPKHVSIQQPTNKPE